MIVTDSKHAATESRPEEHEHGPGSRDVPTDSDTRV